MWATMRESQNLSGISISQDFMFPEDCFNKQSGTLNYVGEFSNGFHGYWVGRKKEVLFGLMEEEASLCTELTCHTQVRGKSSFSDPTA